MTGNSVWLYPSAVIMHQKGQSFSITTLFASTFKHQFAVNLNSCQRGRNIFQPDTDGGVAMVAPWPVDHQRESERPESHLCRPLTFSRFGVRFRCCVCVCAVWRVVCAHCCHHSGRVLSIVSIVCHVSRARTHKVLLCWCYILHNTFYLLHVKANLGALYSRESGGANEIESTPNKKTKPMCVCVTIVNGRVSCSRMCSCRTCELCGRFFFVDRPSLTTQHFRISIKRAPNQFSNRQRQTETNKPEKKTRLAQLK